MKKLTCILSGSLFVLLMSFSAKSQIVFKTANLGIGNVNPSQKVDILGNIKFSQAIMPGGAAGSTGQILFSAGLGLPPTWLVSGSNGQVLSSTGTGFSYITTGYWKLTGNAGTVAGVNYLGTTDDKQFRFYVTGQGGSYNGNAGSLDPQFVGATAFGNVYLGGPNTNNGAGGAGNTDQGSYNVALGFGGMGKAGSTATYNVAAGSHALEYINGGSMTGSFNTAMGYASMWDNSTANGNTGIGGESITSGSSGYNTAAGWQSLYGQLSSSSYFGAYNTAIGYEAMVMPTAGGGGSNTAAGTNALYQSTGSKNTGAGDSTLFTNTTGSSNTALGYAANVGSGALTNATIIGYKASTSASNSITLGNTSASSLYIPGYNTIGSLFYTSSSGLVGTTGAGTSGNFLQSNGPGFAPAWANVTVGGGSVTNVTGTAPITITGTWNVNIQGTAPDAGGVLYSNGAGTSASFTPTGTTGQFLTSTGTGAPVWATSSNAVWALTGNGGTTPGINYIGTNDDEPLQFYSASSYAGNAGSIDPQFVGAIVHGNTYLGDPNGNNIAGSGAGYNDQGSYNVAFGFGCMGYAAATAAYNVAMGTSALEVQSAQARMSGTYNVSMGVSSNIKNATGNYETTIGSGAMQSGVYTSAISNGNTAVGRFALSAGNVSSAAYNSYNTAFGYYALETPSAGAANSITAVGNMAAYNSTGSRNTALGDSALYNNTTGTNNTALGWFANVTGNPTNATVVGYNTTQSASNSITLGNTSASSLYIPGYNTTGSLYYTSASSGLVSSLTPGTSGYFLQSNGPNVAPTWANITPGSGTVTNVTGTAPITVTGVWNVGIQGTAPDQGGVLYSTGVGSSAAFVPTGLTGQYLLSNGTGTPYWGVYPGSSWGLNGNAGTNPSVNFLGTTNSQRLWFETGTTTVLYCGSVDLGTPTGGANGFANVYMGTEASGNSSLGGAGNSDNGSYNAAFGFGTMGNVSAPTGSGVTATASYNVAVGTFTLRGITTGSHNIAFGYGAGYANGGTETAIGTIGMGGNATHNNATGNYDTYLGNSAGFSNTSGNFNTSAGYQSLYTGTTSVSNTGIGIYAGFFITTGNRNTAVGDSTLDASTGNVTTGTNNVALGFSATVGSSTVNGNALTNSIAIGYKATTPASNTITLGTTADVGGTTSATTSGLYIPGYNTIGSLFYTSSASGLVGQTGAGTSGYFLQSNGPGAAPTWANVATGSGTVTGVTGTAPIIINGTWVVNLQGSAPDKGGVLYSTGAGTSALFTSTPASAGLLLTSSASGGAPTWASYTTPASSTWQLTGNSGTVPGTNFIGTTDANRLNIRVNGVTAGTIDLPTTLGGNGNAYYGYGTGYLNNNVASSGATYGDVGTNNTAIGWAAYHAPDYTGGTTASYNIAIGFADINGTGQPTGSGIAGQTGSYNIGTGYNNLYDLTTGNGNIGIGNKSAHGIGVGNYNTGVGYLTFGNTPNASVVGSYNVAIGYSTQITSASANSGIYNSNTSVGYFSLTGVYYPRNTAVGSYALNATATGINNTAIGDSAFFGIAFTTAAPYNTALGCFANTSLATMTNSTVVGARAYASTSNEIVLGDISGVNGATANTNVGIGTNTPATDAALAIKTSHFETQGQLTASSSATTGTVSPGIAAGSGATTTVSGATDVGGQISFTTGSSGVYPAGPEAVITFANSYTYSPIIVIAPANTAAATAMSANGAYATSTTTGFDINFTSAAATSTQYKFNYYAIETAGTSPTSPSVAFPSYPELCDVPITLTNSQGTPTSTGYQQMIVVNSSSYTNEMSRLQNIVFTTAAPVAGATQGTVLNAWIESGDSSSSTSTVYWVNLGSTTIPATSNITIYMNMVSSNVMSSLGPIGEAPQLSSTYAQYDNGSSVFTKYWNFAGTSTPAGLTSITASGGTITFNNGVTIYNPGTAPNGTYLYTTSAIAQGNVAESYFVQQTYPTEPTYAQALLGSMAVNTSTSFGALASTTSYAGSVILQTGQSASGGITVPLDAWNFEIQDAYNIAATFPPPVLAYESALFKGNVWSLGITTTGTLGFGDVNYTNLVSGGSSVKNLSAGFYIGLTLTQGNALYQWLRTRTYPPNGTMPSASTGSQSCTSPITPPTTVCYVPITLTNSQSTAVAAGTTASNGYQEMLTVNSSTYTSYESAGLQNVEFTVGAPSGLGGTQLNSWLESGNSNISNSSIYWLNLGTNGIAASGGTLTVYMNFMPTSNILSSGPSPCAGEAPQLTTTYAQYDNGGLVFNNYWNFLGTGTPSGLVKDVNVGGQTSGAINFNNGALITQGNNWGTYIVTSSTITAPNVTDADVQQQSYAIEPAIANAMLGGIVAAQTQLATTSAVAYSATIDYQTSSNASGITTPTNAWNFEIQSGYQQTTGFPYPVMGYQSTTTNVNFNVFTLGINSSGNLGFGDVNYTNLNTIASGTSPNNKALSSFYVGLQTTQERSFFQWLRTRTYPPNGIMPGAGLGTITCE